MNRRFHFDFPCLGVDNDAMRAFLMKSIPRMQGTCNPRTNRTLWWIGRVELGKVMGIITHLVTCSEDPFAVFNSGKPIVEQGNPTLG